MKPLPHLLMAMLWILSCSTQENPSTPVLSEPKVVKAKGYVVPKDSVELPIIIPAGQPLKVDAVNPTVVYNQSNVHAAGNPRIVPVGTPKVFTPGQNGLPLPQPVAAVFSPAIHAIPEVSAAKEAYRKDHNPHNSSSFSKLQGLKSSLVASILEDNQGNIW